MNGQFDFEALRSLSGGAAISDAACPICGPSRKSAINQRRKTLRIWDDGEFITYVCARCGEKGWASDGFKGRRNAPPREPRKELPAEDKSDLARTLWARSAPLKGSLAETYLRPRQCFVDSPNIRFLPARGDHLPAMIARFGAGAATTGIHLTRLRPDGSGKAGTENDKIMIGPSKGQPIVVTENPDRPDLIVTEGIEDAASFALATGWTAWAAGAGGRIPAVVASAVTYGPVYAAFDGDADIPIRDADGRLRGWRKGAGPAAKQASLALRGDLIPIDLAKCLGRKSDANSVLRQHGTHALLMAIEWSEATARHARGEVGFEGMLREMSAPRGYFSELGRVSV